MTLAWAAKRGISIDFIEPSQPQQNAYVERYNRTVLYDWLAHHLFDTFDELKGKDKSVPGSIRIVYSGEPQYTCCICTH